MWNNVLFLIITLAHKCHTGRRFVEISSGSRSNSPIQAHTDMIYILPDNDPNLIKLTRQTRRIYQIALVSNESHFLNTNVPFSKAFTRTGLLVQKPLKPSTCNVLFNQRNNNTSKLTWVFWEKSFLAQIPQNLKIMDELYYFENTTTLREVYKIKNIVIDQKVNITNRANSIVKRRMNFHQDVFTVAHVMRPSFTSTSGRQTLEHNWGVEFLTYHKLAYMQDVLNFTARLQNVSHWVSSATKEGIGMGDAVRQNIADLALSNTAVWGTVEYRFLFITRLYREIYVYYHALPVPTNRGIEGVVQPWVWIFYFLLAGILFLTSPFFYTNWSFQQSFSWVVGILAEKGVKEPQCRFTVSGRCFFITSLAFGLLFYVSLSTILISILSIKVEISGMEDLKRRGYSFGIWKDSVIDHGFTFGRISDKSPLAVARFNYKTFLKEEEGAAVVASTDKFAFISGQLFFTEYEEVMEKIQGCKRMRLFTLHGEKRWGSAFTSSGSPFTDHFNFARLRMSERGIAQFHLANIERETETQKQNCRDQNATPILHPINMKEVIVVLYIYLAGLVLTIPIFIIERYTTRLKKIYETK